MKHKLINIIVLFIIGFIFRIILNNILDLTSITVEISTMIICIMFSYLDLWDLNNIFLEEIIWNQENNSLNLKKYLVLTKNSSNTDNLLRQSIYNNNMDYTNRLKCKISWILLENNKNNYENYKAYKSSWDSEIKVLEEIKSKISLEYRDEINKWKLRKKTLMWFLSRRNS